MVRVIVMVCGAAFSSILVVHAWVMSSERCSLLVIAVLAILS